TEINQLKNFVSSVLTTTDAKKITKHLDKTIDELEDALEEYNNNEKELKDVVKDLNHAVDECWKAVEETNKLWMKNKLSESDAKNIINEIGNITFSITETSYVTLCNATAKDMTKVENLMVEIRIRCIFEKLSDGCKKIDKKLANAFQHYQKAMEALAENKDYLQEIENGYDKFLKAKEDVSELVKKGKITFEFGNWLTNQINKAILVFPPNLKMTPYDIVIQGPIAKGYKTKITVTVRNVGVVSARDVKVEIYQMSDTTLISSFTIPKIKAGDTVTKTVDWTPTTDGTHEIRVVLDAENTVVEPTKEDNVVSSGVYILSSVRAGRSTEDIVIIGESVVKNMYIYKWNGVDISPLPFYDWLECNLTITSTGSLWFENSNLTFLCGQDGEYSLIVQQSGRLDVLNGSLVTASTEYPYYKFLCYGKLNIRDASTAQWMWGNTSGPNLPGGIQLFSTSDCLIENSTIRKGETHNIYCDGASPRIINSTISYAGAGTLEPIGHGIYCVNGASPTIER
ncbi:MAG: CARDB domain-containing protein, partial [Elusimicrobiota bacterium]|nr:CARDB domain-containing protein [Elusimicrobiota bacterium]